jgi:signal transduction histidine kinase
MRSTERITVSSRSGSRIASPREKLWSRTSILGDIRWVALTGATLVAAVIVDLWVVPQRVFPSLSVIPLLLAAHVLARRSVLIVGLTVLCSHLVALQLAGEPEAAWGLDLLALGVTLWLAFWIAVQREELGRRASWAHTDAAERERDRLDQLAVVAHELRNPLTAMNGAVKMLRRRERYDERLVGMIMRQGRRVDRLARDLTDLASPDTVSLVIERRELDLRDLADEVVENARSTSHRHRFRLVGIPEPLIGRWDPDRLEQILDNLISNAIKYSPDGGDVVVRLARVGDSVRITISDSGVGIPPQDVPHVFERFYRSEQAAGQVRGLGLGLYVVRRLVEAHGGHVSVSTAVGRGTTFVVMLPRKLSSAASEECWVPQTLALDSASGVSTSAASSGNVRANGTADPGHSPNP